MTIDIFAILKTVWGAVTFIVLGVLRITYNNYKKTISRLDEMDRDIIRMKAEMVTKDKLDEIFDKKLKTIRDDVSDLRKDLRGDTNALRNDIHKLLQQIAERNQK